MNVTFQYREGSINDLAKVRQLGIISWSRFKDVLEPAHWQQMKTSIESEHTYSELLLKAKTFLCCDESVVIGMAFLVPSGNPTEIYPPDWCYIRFVSVMPGYENKGIAKQLTAMCLQAAAEMNEETIALHTSEMMDAARHVYEKLGFTITKDLGQRLGKQYWLYKKELKQVKSSVNPTN